jgi:predicted dehydrogenase
MKRYLIAGMRYTLPEPMNSWIMGRAYAYQLRKRERHLQGLVGQKAPDSHSASHGAAKFKVAVIGAGGMGQDQCVGLQTLRQVEIVGVADRNPQAVERLFRQAKVSTARSYDSAETLLRTEKPDMVCVATNTTSHLSVARLAVEAGVKRLIVEKPIGNSVEQAREFSRLCADRAVKVAVNQTRRWSGDYAAIKRCIDHGYIGALRLLYVVPGPGGLAMIGVHFFDLMSYLGDSPIAWAVGSLDTSDRPNKRGPQFKDPGGYSMIGLQNGIRGYLDVSEDLNRKDLFMVLRGDAGRIEIEEGLGVWHLDSPSLGRRTFNFQDSNQESLNFAKVAAQMLSDAPPSCGTAEGIAALEAVVAVHLSSGRNNLKVNLPLQPNDSGPEFAFP